MPKAGHYEYPLRDLDSCLEYLSRAHRQTQNLSVERDIFADALGLSSKTGPFGVLVGSMTHYGLVDTGDGYIRYTDLAKKALFGEPGERVKAREEAVRKVTLFEDIHNRYPVEVSDDQLRLFLRESAGVDVTDAPSVAVKISKIFKKVSPYFHTTTVTEEKSNGGGETKMENTRETTQKIVQPVPTATERFELSDDFGIWVKKDPTAIDFCLAQIDVVKAWLNYVKKKCETKALTEEIAV